MGTKRIILIRNAVVRFIFRSTRSSLSLGYGGSSDFLSSIFGFITGVEQSGQRLSFELSSTPQFTQYDINITTYFAVYQPFKNKLLSILT